MKGCMNCDYCYSNNTMDGLYLCVNGQSEMCGEFVSNLDDEMECCVSDTDYLDGDPFREEPAYDE